eukprot:scaffold7375_cov268-Pinguiococcus_pyrenoidosus.AAC.47
MQSTSTGASKYASRSKSAIAAPEKPTAAAHVRHRPAEQRPHYCTADAKQLQSEAERRADPFML